MSRVIAALVALAASAASAQSINIQVDPNAMGMGMQVSDPRGVPVEARVKSRQVEEHSERTFKYRYESQEGGRTTLKVLAPEGAHVDIYDGAAQVVSDEIPTVFEARGDVFYKFVVRARDGATFEKKFQSKKGHAFSLWVLAPNTEAVAAPVAYREPAPARVGMSESDFEALKGAIQQESYSSEKLGVLGTAAQGARFSAEQVGELIDLYDYSRDKLSALQLVKGRIEDRNNSYRILSHFDYVSDKQQAQQMLR